MWLPPAERRGEIHFYFAKSLPYGTRMTLAFCLIAAGLLLQFILLSQPFWWAAAFLVLAGVSLLLTRGYANVASARVRSREWRPARREEVQRILELNKKQKAWDIDAVDISNVWGCFVLFLIIAVVGFAVYAIAGPFDRSPLSRMIVLNAAVMFLPFWITGTRSILKNDKLVTKAKMMLAIEDLFAASGKREGEDFQYQLQVSESKDEKGQVPSDVKAILLFHSASPDFLGLQMQISINSVQGTDYPYFYCVLVAKPEFGGFHQCLKTGPRGITVEVNTENDVDVCVIRQATTKNSGYHTKPRDAANIFQHALTQARQLLAAR